jgi:hypothetical protein
MGIVSATGRTNLGIEDYEDFIRPTRRSILKLRRSTGQ